MSPRHRELRQYYFSQQATKGRSLLGFAWYIPGARFVTLQALQVIWLDLYSRDKYSCDLTLLN